MLRAVGRGIDTDAWSWLCDQAGQMLFEPPNVSGWDDTRWLDTATFRAPLADGDRDLQPGAARRRAPRSPPDAAEARRAAPPRFWGTRRCRRATRSALERYAKAAMAAADEPWKRESYPVLTENALRMLIAVSPDYLTHDLLHDCPHLLRRARPRRRRPARDRARHADARRHRPVAPLVPAALGRARAVGLRRRQARPRAVRGGRRAGRRPAPGHGARQRVPRRRRRQHVDPRADRRPGLPPPAPEPRAAGERQRVRRGRAADLAPDRGAARRSCTPRARSSVLPAVGYDHPDQSHFVSRHFWEVGATDAGLRSGWLGRLLDVIGTRRQPAAGRLDGREPRARRSRPRACRSRRSTPRRRSASGCPAPGARRPTSA